MSFYPHWFQKFIRKTLIDFSTPYGTESAVNLLLGTAATESGFGTYLTQIGGGPALGVFQMEPLTCIDLWDNWLKSRQFLRERIAKLTGKFGVDLRALEGDLSYQVLMARCNYARRPEPLPKADDICGLASYWKKYWNTEKGQGTAEKFVKDFDYFMKGVWV